jgi:hypothetical protein
MNRWIVRTLVVAAVIGAYALGRGLQASAEVPSARAVSKPFICGTTSTFEKLSTWMTGGCDPDRSITMTHHLVYGGTGEAFQFCCVQK